jgi:hypothetical protein
MAKVKLTIDDKEYTEDQFKSDMIRMFDAYRDSNSTNMGKATCGGVTCYYCPLYLKECNAKRAVSFEIIKCVYDWAQKHPLQTNADKLIEIFGEDVLPHINLIDSKEYWLKKEYKDPKGENKNDD